MAIQYVGEEYLKTGNGHNIESGGKQSTKEYLKYSEQLCTYIITYKKKQREKEQQQTKG